MHDGGRSPGQHLLALKCPHVEATVGKPTLGSHVIAVRPHADLGIVRIYWIARRVVGRKRIQVPSAGDRVVGSGDGDALAIVGGRVHCELADQPAIRQMVVSNDRIAIVVGLARPAEAVPQRVDGRGAGQQIAVLVINGKGRIYRLNVVGRADGAHRVGGYEAGGRDAVEVAGHRGSTSLRALQVRHPLDRITRWQGSLLGLLALLRRRRADSFQVLHDLDRIARLPDLRGPGAHQGQKVGGLQLRRDALAHDRSFNGYVVVSLSLSDRQQQETDRNQRLQPG